MSSPHTPDKSHTIEVKLTVPKIGWLEKLAKNTLRQLHKKRLLVSVAAAAVIALVIIAVFVIPKATQQAAGAPDTAQQVVVSEQDRTATVPFYETLLPVGKSIEQLGGWTRVSPPDRNAVFAFMDHIDQDRIVVSQQPLPEDFKEDTEAQVEQLAKGYKATEKITVDGMTVYIAKSAKGPQSVVFAKKGLLVLIRSSVTISNDRWISYIDSLQ